MKQTYEKPMLYAESFELAEHIGKNCNPDAIGLANLRDQWSCNLELGQGMMLFISNNIKKECNYNLDEEGYDPEFYWGSTEDYEKPFAS